MLRTVAVLAFVLAPAMVSAAEPAAPATLPFQIAISTKAQAKLDAVLAAHRLTVVRHCAALLGMRSVDVVVVRPAAPVSQVAEVLPKK